VATNDIIKILSDQEAERERSNGRFMEIIGDLRQQDKKKNRLLERLVLLQDAMQK
jgi:hypothetical protein